MAFEHIPVLLASTIESLQIDPDGIYVDGTAGGGGHSEEIAKRLSRGRLYSIDRDPDAIRAAGERLRPYPQAKVLHGNFKDMKNLLAAEGVVQVNGILLDIGVSSHQLDCGERGFSFHQSAPLDMRMSQEGMTAAEVVNTYSETELARVLWEYGEEKFSRRIAAAILREREREPIQTTDRLAQIICDSVPAAARRNGHPARQTFQALRIEVNGELENLRIALEDAFALLAPGGVLLVITFHSLEDRIVKQQYNEWKSGCICPKNFPVCVCGKKARGEVAKPVTASPEELEENPRSRSAKLRSIRKL